VMPNHIHGVVVIWGEEGATCRAPTGRRVGEEGCGDARDPGITFPPLRPPELRNRFGPLSSGSLGSVIRAFKAAVTKQSRDRGLWTTGSVWQRGYYEHLIRSGDSLGDIRIYIRDNPLRWMEEQ
jgi:REP element-mobilizing transposase RayT